MSRGHGREDLAKRMQLAKVRITRPSTVVAVVGEFKQGKTSLINALLDEDLLPVAPETATTAMAVLYHADRTSARASRREGEASTTESVDIDALGEILTGDGADGAVDMVEIGLPAPILRTGMSLVDTPGAGGSRSRSATALLGFLPVADALIFVTDASVELTADEIDLLNHADDTGARVLVALTKVDMHPEWRRIRDLDAAHLARAGSDAPIIPVSAAVHAAAAAWGDPELDSESGISDLRAALEEQVVDRGRSRAAGRARREAANAITQLLTSVEAERAALEDPERAATMLGELEHAAARLAELRRAGSRWSMILQDGFTDVRSETDYAVRTLARETIEWSDEQLDDIDPGKDWEPFAESLQERTTSTMSEIFERLYTSAATVSSQVASVIEPDAVGPDVHEQATIDLQQVWGDRTPTIEETNLFSTSIEVLRGSYGGVLLLGMVARLATLPLLGPLSIGAGIAFGVRQVIEVRRKRRNQRRQEAKRSVRSFIEAAQLEISASTRRALQELQRDLRSSFLDRNQELQEEQQTTVDRLRRAQEEGRAGRARRLPALRSEEQELRELLHEVTRTGREAT